MKNIKSILSFLLLPLLFVGGCKKEADPCLNKKNYTLKQLSGNGGSYLDVDNAKKQVSMLFQVLDQDKKGVTGLNDVNLYSLIDYGTGYSDEEVGSAEAQVKIDTFGTIPVTVNTILLLDLSASIGNYVQQIKESATLFVTSSISEQQIAIYTFDGVTPVQRIDFTNDKAQLLAAINALPSTGLGSSTNLYDAIQVARTKLPTEVYNTTQIIQSNVLLFTDGKETAHPTEKAAAIDNASYMTVFVAALQSSDLDETTLKQLAGTDKNYFKANSIADLSARFTDIQNDIQRLSRSVYWLYYKSPRRGNNICNVKLSLKNNCNTLNNEISGSYSSSGF